jgi:multiple sugar transport system permease protein/raffinose/stachyose/melibiose transport system permease protein
MKRRAYSASGTFVGYLMVLPFYLLFFIFSLIPIVIGLLYSFTDYNLVAPIDFVGLKNYNKLLHDPIFLQSMLNTALYSLYTIIPSIAIGLFIAILLNGSLPGLAFFRVCFYLPFIISMVAASMVWLWIFEPSVGLLNALLSLFGLEPLYWLHDKKLAMISISIMSIWKVVGYNMIIYLAGLQNIPRMYYEAASLEGARAGQRFSYITFPLLAPTTFFLFATSCINAFNVFVQVNVLTNGGPDNTTTTIVHQIYTRAFTELNMGYASSMAMVLFAIVVFITLANFRYGNIGADIDLQ